MYLADARFCRFLEYLKYWTDRRYSLLLAYPACLQTLELLTNRQCAEVLFQDPQAVAEVDQSHLRQWAQTGDRGIESNLWCDSTSSTLPPDLLGPEPTTTKLSSPEKFAGPPNPNESLTEAATFAGKAFFEVHEEGSQQQKNLFDRFAHVYKSHANDTESLWKFEDASPSHAPIKAFEGIPANSICGPLDPVIMDNRMPSPRYKSTKREGSIVSMDDEEKRERRNSSKKLKNDCVQSPPQKGFVPASSSSSAVRPDQHKLSSSSSAVRPDHDIIDIASSVSGRSVSVLSATPDKIKKKPKSVLSGSKSTPASSP